MVSEATVYPAHILIHNNGEELVQTVAEHLRNTAVLAAEAGKAYGLEKAAYLLGMVHDAGKYSDAFKSYIEKASKNEHVVRGSVNHTFTGVRLIMKEHGKSATCTMEDIALEVLAYAAGAHHGLFDCVTEKGINEFERRIHEDLPSCSQSIARYYQEVMDEAALGRLICQAVEEISFVLNQCRQISSNAKQMKFCIGLTARLLLSILIDADRRDTAAFMSNEWVPETFGAAEWKAMQDYTEAAYRDMVEHAARTEVNQARQTISSSCVKRICGMGNVIRLNIPTGAGKTITSLRSALALVNERDKAHIIYTAPLLTILEQNANEIRCYVGNDEAVLEHHSNVISTEDSEDIAHSRDLLAQNWAAPVIVTTMVQLLNTMFDGTTSSIRRFHALANSVIIIDEVQTVPKKMLTMFNLTLSFLSEICQTTFILCSATQPYLEKASNPPLVPIADLMPYQEAIWKPFRRTNLIAGDRMKLSEMPDFIEQKMEEHDSLLVVCNKKAEAAFLMNAVSIMDAQLVHLSASMCTEHRREALRTIRTCLEQHQKVLCISTQVIEAGVDISFKCVIRFMAGMDSIVQAAGRCNRNGENSGLSPVYIVHCEDERLAHLPDIEAGKTATFSLLNDFRHDPAKYGERLESDEAIRTYYTRLYQNMLSGAQDMPIRKTGLTMFQLLSDNALYAKQDVHHGHYYMTQAFKTAGAAFEVFDSEGKTVIVPWGEGQQIIDALQEVYADDYDAIKRLIQRARSYAITVYDYQFRQLYNAGGIIELLDGAAYALSPQFYDREIGLTLPDNQFLEV